MKAAIVRPKLKSIWGQHVEGVGPGGIYGKTERETVAIIAVHGMGQQLPFETVQGICEILSDSGIDDSSISSLRHPDGDLIYRAELPLEQYSKNVHIYEVYWAPLTQNKASLLQVFQFLIDSAIKGFELAKSGHFYRSVIGHWDRYPTGSAISQELYAVLFVSVLLFVQLLGLPLVFCLLYLNLIPGHRLDHFLPEFTTITICAGLCYLYLRHTSRANKENSDSAKVNHSVDDEEEKTKTPPARQKGFLGIFAFVCLLAISSIHIVLLLTKAAGFDSAVDQLLSLLTIPSQFLGAAAHAAASGVAGSQVGAWRKFLEFLYMPAVMSIWMAQLYVVYFVADKLTSYLGDVAIYVWANRLNEFYEIRQAIRHASQRTFSFVYGMKEEPAASEDGLAESTVQPTPKTVAKPLYKEVIVIGHSLGSVVAYDALNDLVLNEIVDDKLSESKSIKRTSLFLTFGSPLDKIAFFFQSQAKTTESIRDVFASHCKPLTREYKFRPQEWINVYSKADIISGSLDLYDPLAEISDATEKALAKRRHVKNVEDSDADVFLLAHNMYWTNPLIKKIIHKALSDRNGHITIPPGTCKKSE